MSISIQGVKITKLEISKNEQGMPKASGTYELISSNGITLAKQDFNSYNGIAVAHSPATTKLLNDLFDGIRFDLNMTLGLEHI